MDAIYNTKARIPQTRAAEALAYDGKMLLKPQKVGMAAQWPRRPHVVPPEAMKATCSRS
jgi:hypothetical protein